jgi:hypothetical protein
MALSEDDLRLAEALAIRKQHGDAAEFHIARRIGELAAVGDWAGVDRWKAVATALDEHDRASRS